MTAMNERGALHGVGHIMAAGIVVLTFYAVGDLFLDGYALDLGSILLPVARHAYFMLIYTVVGTLIATLLGIGLYRLVERRASKIVEQWSDIPDRRWVVLISFLSAAVPLALRFQLLDSAPLVDDESAYRFSAELLASGRLWGESPPLKLFFDRAFMINDGRLYSQYPLGWPALMVPGVWLGNTGLMNPLYSALTVPPLFFVLRRLCGSNWAKLGVLLYPLSPMLMVGAAIEVSHTSCLMALAWLMWFVSRSLDDDAPMWVHAAVSFFFSLTFFIRPTSALGIGIPFLLVWGLAVLRLRGRARFTAIVAFMVPAVVLAGLFLLVNDVQNGSYWTVAYQRGLAYARENDFRFSAWPNGTSIQVVDFAFDSPYRGLAVMAAAWIRLNSDLFGWPLSLFFAVFAIGVRAARLHLACAVSFCVVHFFVKHVGVDTFAPMHFYELSLPSIVLTVLGLQRLTKLLGELMPDFSRLRSFPIALAAAAVLTGLVCFVPVRFGAIIDIVDHVTAPRDAIEGANVHRAIIFSPRPFAPSCSSWTARHFVFWRPNNDPDLENDVLWVNHISVETDRLLMEHFPDREGYVAVWTTDCRVVVANLDELEPGEVPNGIIGGSGIVPELGAPGANIGPRAQEDR